MAELERLVRGLVQEIHDFLNGQRIPTSSLRHSLLAVAADDKFDTIASGAKPERAWTARLEIAGMPTTRTARQFPIVHKKGPQPPLDGATLKPFHFQRLWEVYGLDGDPAPDPRWSTSLEKLSSTRNDVAHANMTLSQIVLAEGPTAEEFCLRVHRWLIDLLEFEEHVDRTVARYLSTGGYFR